ncbi:MAG: SAM-dependent chlorinase/fluorinase [Myxococcales bacterium]|nr:SAM-dependent chlorinase/fluorinase [Myxococcales bacterium]
MAAPFSPSGVITITTDFGHRGPFVGVMKGVMLRRFPQARVVDLTHETHVHWPAEAGFWLERAYPYFPAGTVHLAVVDPGVGTERGVLLVEGDGHLFIAPDNGLLAGVVERLGGRALRVDDERLQGLGLGELSATFHGRDLFAPLAAELAAGNVTPEDIASPCDSHVPSLIDPPELRGDEVRGVVVTTDHFGNLITNIDAVLLERFSFPVALVAGRWIPVRRTYASVSPGDFLALINSFDVLEIARAEQSAAAALGLGWGAPVSVVED